MAKPDPITTDNAAETAALAAMEFEPWDRPLAITAEHWQDRLLPVNVALAVMTKSKPELIHMLATYEARELFEEKVAALQDLEEELHNLADAIGVVRGRLAVALAAEAAQPH